jgi:hypothetical protein
LLSREYLELTRSRLAPGGVLLYNTTSSEDAMRTGLEVFAHGLRVYNCMAVSDSPLRFDAARWEHTLRTTRIDGVPPIDPGEPSHREKWEKLVDLPQTFSRPAVYEAVESKESLLARIPDARVITDDNMLTEFLWLRD